MLYFNTNVGATLRMSCASGGAVETLGKWAEHAELNGIQQCRLSAAIETAEQNDRCLRLAGWRGALGGAM